MWPTDNRPTTGGNISLTEELSANTTLEDFEKQEREIVEQINQLKLVDNLGNCFY